MESIKIKAHFVKIDENEILINDNSRAMLNFGHTFGHALESMNNYKRNLIHGEAISIGMCLAMKISCKMNLISINEYNDFILLNFYFPNGQMNEDRLQYKLRFHEAAYRLFLSLRRKKKNLIICGDYNIAHNEIDLKHPKPNENTSGFLRIERDWLDKFQKKGFIDTFRHFYPNEVKYSWWTYMRNARQNNAGWRIDYFWVSQIEKVKDSLIHNEVYGSDHCPVSIVV